MSETPIINRDSDLRETARLRRRIDALEALLSELPQVFQATVVTPSVAGTPFVVTHKLGLTPDEITTLADATGAEVYATAADKRTWNGTTVTLRCEKASAELLLTIRSNPGARRKS